MSLLAGLALPAPFMAQERPNIIYIMTDQQSAMAMSCAGNKDVHTPNMDRLAERGVRFENAYCAFPLSGPARTASHCPIRSVRALWAHWWKPQVILPHTQASGMYTPTHFPANTPSALKTYTGTTTSAWRKRP